MESKGWFRFIWRIILCGKVWGFFQAKEYNAGLEVWLKS
jgi:hypothetical protein